MEVVTLDIINAMINCWRYADNNKLVHIKRTAVLATYMSDILTNEEKSYQVFMAALLKDIGDIGSCNYCNMNKETDIKFAKYKNYRSAEIIRTMPEIMPFQYDIADIILESEEKIDGSGFPAGKDKLLLEAQIIGAADDYSLERDIEKMEESKSYSKNIIELLRKVEDEKKLIEMFENQEKIDNEFKSYIKKYNVYKSMISGVEEEQFLSTVAAMIDAKHSYTAGHTKRVAAYSYAIAKELEYSPSELSEIRHAAYLHDIGKLGVDIGILDKPDKLSDEEFEKIKEHARFSYEILEDSPGLKKFVFGALHHERVDGKGYPFGLKGEELPEGAKIIAIADVLDALTSNRSYRKPFTFKEAFELMEMMVGTAFDKEVFEAAKMSFNI